MTSFQHNNLGVRLYQKKHYPQALIQYRHALRLKPNYLEAHFNLAVLYLVTHQLHYAVRHFKQALSHPPAKDGLIQALVQLTRHYQQHEKYAKALKTINQAIKLSPGQPELIYNQGIIMEQLGKLNQAIHAYLTCIQLKPDLYQAYSQLYMVKRKAFDWHGMEKIESLLDMYYANTPFVSLVRTENLTKNLFAARTNAIYNSRSIKPTRKSYLVNRKSIIKVGYFSKDFGDHPIGQLVAPLFQYHDRARFEIYAFSYGANDHSPFYRQIQNSVDHFIDINQMDDPSAIQSIKKHGIDLLIDLSGNTVQNRYPILAARPALVQITWLGLLGTSGTNFIDYQLVDPLVVPQTHAIYYTEKLLYLPHVLPLYTQLKTKPLPRKAYGLPDNAFIFACFNQPYKITPELFSVWMSLLKSVPNSILWLWDREPEATANLKTANTNAGLNPNRLIFFKRLPLKQHLSRAQLADIALNTTIYGGGATSAQTLQAGVPVITLQGKHYASLLTASLLIQANLPDLIAHSLTEYQSKAIDLALSPSKITSLKSIIKNQRSNLLEFVHNLESAYQLVWDRYQHPFPPKLIALV